MHAIREVNILIVILNEHLNLFSLSCKIKKNIVVRHIPHTDPWSQKKEFEKFLGKGSISKRKNFLDEVKNSKIIINTALQTTFFESMLSGVPTIVLLKDDLWNLSEEGKKIYNLIQKRRFEDEEIMGWF